jgi:predicted secreted protein
MTTEPNKQGEKRMGRPPEPVPQAKANEIIEWIASGQTLREFCRQEGNPAWRTVYEWLEKDEEFAARFARAREMGHDAIAEECLEIIDSEAEMAETFSQSGGSKHRDSAHVSWMKNRVEMRLKLLAKWNPKKYGDKVDVTSAGEKVGFAINIDMGEKP